MYDVVVETIKVSPCCFYNCPLVHSKTNTYKIGVGYREVSDSDAGVGDNFCSRLYNEWSILLT